MGWYDGMDSGFAARLRAFIEASGGRIGVGSGYRSVEEQASLYADAVAKYGEEEAGWYVAPPGNSNHNHGVAADLSYLTDDATEWAHANAYRFGLTFPMDWEDWHIEPIGVRDGTYQSDVPVDGFQPGSAEAYTTPPPGEQGVQDATRRYSLEYQMESLMGILASPAAPLLGSGGTQSAAPLAAEPTQLV